MLIRAFLSSCVNFDYKRTLRCLVVASAQNLRVFDNAQFRQNQKFLHFSQRKRSFFAFSRHFRALSGLEEIMGGKSRRPRASSHTPDCE